MIDLKENEYLNEIPRFDPFKGKMPTPFMATHSYSYGVDTNGKKIIMDSIHTGCHSFVKSRIYGKGHSLCVVVPITCCFYQKEEIEEYINLLKQIGFQIEFKGILTDAEVEKNHGGVYNMANKENYVFLLGEDYKNNVASVRYAALCLVRALWNTNQFWLPYRFVEFYRYFKKRKIKPSLSKILVLANLCPHNLISDSYIFHRIKETEKGDWEAKKDIINKESGLLGGYYGFIGHSNTDVILNSDYECIYKSFYISLLLIGDNKFNIIDFIENYNINGKLTGNLSQINHLNINTYGKTRMIRDDKNILNNKLRELLKDKLYYKAFLYLKEIAISYKQFPDSHFTNLDLQNIGTMDNVSSHYILPEEKSEKFIAEFVEKTSKEKKKSK